MNNIFTLPISLDKSNVMQYLDRINKYSSNISEEVIINCSEVEDIDSAGIALLVELSQYKTKYKFVNLSISIQNLCHLYQISFDK